MKKAFHTLFLFFVIMANAQEIIVSSGKVQRFDAFKSQFVDPRNIDVWVPDGYSSDEKYAVVYMQDGQISRLSKSMKSPQN